MKKLVLLSVAALALSSCGSPSAPAPAPYSALGIWDIKANPTGTTDWRSLGYVKFTAQDVNGGLDGTYNDIDGARLGITAGNVNTGRVGLLTVLFEVKMDGVFNGDNYIGSYSIKSTDGSASSGNVKLTRRK